MILTKVNVTPVRSRTQLRFGVLDQRVYTDAERHSKRLTPAEQHFKTGDLVWMVEETNPRGYYSTARILKFRYSSNIVVRSAV